MKSITQRLVDGFPAIVVALWAGLFAVTGTSLPIAGEAWWQLAAAVVAVGNLAVAAFPYSDTRRFVAGVVTVAWLAVWTGYLTTALVKGGTDLSERVSPWGISQFALLATFVAWSYGRRPMNKVIADMVVNTDER